MWTETIFILLCIVISGETCELGICVTGGPCTLTCNDKGSIDLNKYISYDKRERAVSKEMSGDAGKNGFMMQGSGCKDVKLVKDKHIEADCGTSPYVSVKISEIVNQLKRRGNWHSSAYTDGLYSMDPVQATQPETVTVIVSQWIIFGFFLFCILVIALTVYNIRVFLQQRAKYHM
eukprot:71133_1